MACFPMVAGAIHFRFKTERIDPLATIGSNRAPALHARYRGAVSQGTATITSEDLITA